MPLPGDDTYQLPPRYPAVYGLGVSATARMEVHKDGALVAPSGGTFKLLDAAGTAVASGTVTVTDDVATFSVTGSALTTAGVGKAYREVWTLTVAGRTLNGTRPAAIARYPLECPVSQAEVLRSHKDLVRRGGSLFDNLQSFIDDAWAWVLRQLWQRGQWPDEIVDVDQLHDIVLEDIKFRVHDLLASSPEDMHWARRAEAMQARDHAIAHLSTRVDRDQDGVEDDDEREGLGGAVHIAGAPSRILPRWA